MRRLLREPLVHFLALGAALFLFFSLKSGAGGGASGPIVVTRARLDAFVAGFQRTRQRPPTAEELKGLIDGYVREEAAVREAMASGLDRDDTIIRRRLKQKVDFLAEDRADSSPPTDADLTAWLAAHADVYRVGEHVPALADVRAAVERDFVADRRTRELDALYARLLAHTKVVVEAAPEKK
ncbi:MAG: hypothetical protein ACHQM4_11205 [Thermoanaerobaculia bacterium]